MPTSPAGTLWRHSLLNKVFRHESSDSFLQTKTAVLNSGYHNSFDSFIVLFSKTPLPEGRENVFGYRYRSSTSSWRTGKGKGREKGKGKHLEGKSSLSKSSKKLSKRSIDAFMYRHTPVQVFDFFPMRPVYYVFPARPPHSTPSSSAPLTQEPTESKNPTVKPSLAPSSIQKPSEFPILSASPSSVPSVQVSQEPNSKPSASPSQTSSIVSICRWTACGDPNSEECSSGSSLQFPDSITVGNDPDGQVIAVRCCSDIELPNFEKRNDDCPYADTQINGQCYNSVTYQEALSLCTSIEARLCTKDELELRCTVGTGCGHNNLPVWSSTIGPLGYFDVGVNSFKAITPSEGDNEVPETFSCREGVTTDIGILKYDEGSCSAECLFSIPFAKFENYCSENANGVFTFTIPGPFTGDTQLYIGIVADNFKLECTEELLISFG